MFIISTTVWVNGWDTSSVASRAKSELTSSQCNWKGNRKGKGTDETPPLLKRSIFLEAYFFAQSLICKEVTSYKNCILDTLPIID